MLHGQQRRKDKGQSPQQTVLGKLDNYKQKHETGPLSYTIHKNELEMEQRFKHKAWNHKTRRKQAGSKHPDIDLGSGFFLDFTEKAKETKAKINKWHYKSTVIKNFSNKWDYSKLKSAQQSKSWTKWNSKLLMEKKIANHVW